jgi:hypothetical protein
MRKTDFFRQPCIEQLSPCVLHLLTFLTIGLVHRRLDKLITVMHAFDVTDGLAARLMDHAERYRFLVGDRGGELDGNDDKGQAEIA